MAGAKETPIFYDNNSKQTFVINAPKCIVGWGLNSDPAREYNVVLLNN